MNFAQATDLLLAGKKVQRASWRDVRAGQGESGASMWVEMREDKLSDTSYPVLMLRKADGTTRQLPAYRPTTTDKFGQDWQEAT